MVVRVRSVAALAAVAALPFAAHATDLSPTPIIGCNADGLVDGINWGDGFSLGAPSVSVTPSVSAASVLLPAVQSFNCSDNMYSTGVRGSMFAVNFGTPGTTPSGDKLQWKFDTTGYQESKFDAKYNVTEFDIYANFVKIGTGALDNKDFIGIKYWSTLGDALSPENKLFLNANGELVLDPPIGGGSGILELTPTPGAPVPEPATFVLFGTGLLAAAQALRRKSRA